MKKTQRATTKENEHIFVYWDDPNYINADDKTKTYKPNELKLD